MRRQRPKELNYGSVGVGSSQHLAGAYFEQVAGVQAHPRAVSQHRAVHARTSSPGTVPLGFQFLPNVLGMLSSGDARALAVTSPKRMTALPDVPTAREAGSRVRDLWLARAARRRAGTPKPMVDKLQQGARAAAAERSGRARPFHRAGRRSRSSPRPRSSHKFIASETVKWRDIITKAGHPADPIRTQLMQLSSVLSRRTTARMHDR